MNGLPKRGLISCYATGMLDDWDDLHKACSFEENEENSSIIANASCSMSSSHPRASRPGKQIPVVGAEKESTATVTVDTLHEGKKGDTSFSQKSLKVVKTLRQLFPIRFRPPPLVFRSSSMKTNKYYQEMVEEDEHEHEGKENQADDSMTTISRRSTRNNVRTGRTMLVRQKAKVFSSSHPSVDSTSYRNILPRQRSLTLDHSSSDTLSDITEDNTSIYRSFSTMDHLSFRRRQMFIDEHTHCIKEDRDEGDDDDADEYTSETNNKSERHGVSVDDSNIMECGYDFRTLLSIDEKKEPTFDNNYVNSDRPLDNNTEVTSQVHTESSWQREITDTDSIVFENDSSGSTDILSSTKEDSLFTNQEEPFPTMKSYSSRSASSSPLNYNTGHVDSSCDLFNSPHASAAFPRFHLDNDAWPESTERTDSDDACRHRTPPTPHHHPTFDSSPIWGDLDHKQKIGHIWKITKSALTDLDNNNNNVWVVQTTSRPEDPDEVRGVFPSAAGYDDNNSVAAATTTAAVQQAVRKKARYHDNNSVAVPTAAAVAPPEAQSPPPPPLSKATTVVVAPPKTIADAALIVVGRVGRDDADNNGHATTTTTTTATDASADADASSADEDAFADEFDHDNNATAIIIATNSTQGDDDDDEDYNDKLGFVDDDVVPIDDSSKNSTTTTIIDDGDAMEMIEDTTNTTTTTTTYAAIAEKLKRNKDNDIVGGGIIYEDGVTTVSGNGDHTHDDRRVSCGKEERKETEADEVNDRLEGVENRMEVGQNGPPAIDVRGIIQKYEGKSNKHKKKKKDGPPPVLFVTTLSPNNASTTVSTKTTTTIDNNSKSKRTPHNDGDPNPNQNQNPSSLPLSSSLPKDVVQESIGTSLSNNKDENAHAMAERTTTTTKKLRGNNKVANDNNDSVVAAGAVHEADVSTVSGNGDGGADHDHDNDNDNDTADPDLDKKKKLVGRNTSLLDTADFVPSVTTRSKRDDRLSLDAHSELLLSHRQPLHIMCGLEEQNPLRPPTRSRSRTHSDSLVRGTSCPGARASWDARNQSLLDYDDDTQSTSITEGLVGTSEVDSSPVAFPVRHRTTTTVLLSKKRRSSATKKVEHTANTTTISPVTGSVLATLSPPTNNATGELQLSAHERVIPLQSSSGRQPSPRILNAANMIITALRPAPAPTPPMLPTKPSCIIAGHSDNNSWNNQGAGTVEMCEIQEQQQTGIPTPAHTQPMLPTPSCSAGQSDNCDWNQGAGNVEMCEILQNQQTGTPRSTWSFESFDDVFILSKARFS